MRLRNLLGRLVSREVRRLTSELRGAKANYRGLLLAYQDLNRRNNKMERRLRALLGTPETD